MSEDARALLAHVVAALGGEQRPGQAAMADAVEDALANASHAMIQAGTGTGKSLGYLVPAVARAVREDERIVVSTATLALQRQVYLKDLPLVTAALAEPLGGTPRVGLLKGRANYLCRHKLAGGYPEPEDDALPIERGPTSELGRQVARLHEWAEVTATGDRDDLQPGVPARAWAQVSVTARECLGSNCPLVSACFCEKARAEAARANIVVTNHAVLAIEATNQDMLGPHDALIVDEAHELVSRITTFATHELTVSGIEAAARAARRCGVATGTLDDASRALERLWEDYEPTRLRLGLDDPLTFVISAVRDSAREAERRVKDVAEASGSAAQVAAAALAEVRTVAAALVEQAGELVVWLAPADGDYGSRRVTRALAAPLDVAALIRERLVDGKAAVFTSATLALGGTFDAMAAHLGLDHPAVLDAGSPFDYGTQGILYVAQHLPPPGQGGISDAALDELEALITAAGGRTLGLFSSHKAALTAAEAMRLRLDVPVLYQLDDQVSTLVQQFKDDPSACLFGSTTLWQGIDLPGDTATLVVIDRIPFPRPDDPISQARTEKVAARGGNGFMAISATQAALMLAQGAGRLIRTMTDRGVVAVLDSRLATARYGGFLARSMPALWPTTDRALVLEALRRLHESADSEK